MIPGTSNKDTITIVNILIGINTFNDDKNILYINNSSIPKTIFFKQTNKNLNTLITSKKEYV